MDRASRTAQQVTLFRALESARRDRIFDDPLAVRFLPPGYRLLARLARFRPVGVRLERYIDGRWAGPRASAVARTRLIDDLVGAALAADPLAADTLAADTLAADALAAGPLGADALAAVARQVLILGAGYDSRADRLPAARAVPVFEADHPATQAAKRRLVGASWPNVRFIPVDLNRDDLAAALDRAGFAARKPTVVVWEGVTNYLSDTAVDATLRLLAGLLAANSKIIFTYVDRGVLTGDIRDADEWHAAVRRQGEPWTFGFDPPALPGYLTARGLRLTLDLSTREAADRYLAPLGRHEPAATFYRVAQAEVAQAEIARAEVTQAEVARAEVA